MLERRDLVNNLTSNSRAAVQEILSQREAAIAASVAVAKLLAKGAEDYAVYLHLLACALQLAAPAAVAGKTQPILETSAVADGGAVISLKVLDGAVPEAHAQFESSSAKHAREGGEEEDLDSTEQQRDQACREEQLRTVQLYNQLWVAPGGPRLRGPPARRRGRLRPLPGRGRHRRRQRSRRPPLDCVSGVRLPNRLRFSVRGVAPRAFWPRLFGAMGCSGKVQHGILRGLERRR